MKQLNILLILLLIAVCLVLISFPSPVQSATYPVQLNFKPQIQADFRAIREITLQATAYSHTGQKTFTGTWPKEGRTIAVDPETIPIGSLVWIQGFGWRIAEDKIPPGSIRKGAKIDIFMDNESRCWEWGRRNVRVIIIPPRK